ncbi:hypothetical protein MAA_10553 [Metarhizium robertsii ARSEF 23]|uniref:Nuf2 DHR10-like domain-containing protein n=1 Tax=Metarhizium robertsii (strain ARSEF 23 / ATCC MYA-3075) TaxID=655844 RepID=E9FE54_METRA|nr:uncharacterized protein MAA_10553 [Metarhizium robertsii ARSEF 23]EFY93986.2 hypothetical protein MAA_10553 [Metarhizium robertsii ARSEF 23]
MAGQISNSTDYKLREILNNDKAHIGALYRRARALQTSADSFNVVSTDVASSIKILDEIATGLAKEKEEMVRNAKERDALSERGNNAREVERAGMLRLQLSKWTDRTEKLCEQSNQKAQEAKAKMHELRAIHRKLTEEHTEKSKEMERLDILGPQMEKTSISCRGFTQIRKREATQQGQENSSSVHGMGNATSFIRNSKGTAKYSKSYGIDSEL